MRNKSASIRSNSNQSPQNTVQNISRTSSIRKRLLTLMPPLFLIIMGLTKSPLSAMAMAAGGGPKGPVAPMKRDELISSISLFFFLFTVLALLHAAEIAITTLYPWKVREFAEAEEKQNGNKGRGVFKILNEDITRVLTTILVTSTASSIYGTLNYTIICRNTKE